MSQQRQIGFATIVLPLLLAMGGHAAPGSPWRFADVARIVAISDIHGDVEAMTETLRRADIIDVEQQWQGGNSHLVIVGDILDRGPSSRQAMDLLMRLEQQAAATGGAVHVLVGNHEAMLLTGDMRYVSAAEYAAFAAEETAAERERWLLGYAERLGLDAAVARASFDEQFPVGYFAMRRAFRPNGKYGAWLLEKNFIVVIDGTAFVHGGLSPLVTNLGLDGLNASLGKELRAFTGALNTLTDASILLPTDSHYDYAEILRNAMPKPNASKAVMNALRMAVSLNESKLLGTDGPLWYRENVSCQDIIEEHRLLKALKAIEADRVVVGHTPTPNRQILQRFNGRLLEIDTGMLDEVYHGSGNALAIMGERIEVINQRSESTSVPLPHPRGVGRRPDAMSAAALAQLLADGDLQRHSQTHGDILPADNVQVRLQAPGGHVSAVFSAADSASNLPPVAAYRLDRLLGLDMVPVTVIRELDGQRGALQFLPEKRSNEVERAAAGDGGAASCPLPQQWSAMYLFDALGYSESRAPSDMLYDPSSWRLILSNNSNMFSARKGRPPYLRSAELTLTAGWVAALKHLDDATIEEHFADVLDQRRRRALSVRRDELLRSTR